MKTPVETLFATCQDMLGRRTHTIEDFLKECKKDKVLGDGVEAVCKAMIVYSEPYRQEVKELTIRLQEAMEELASMKKDSVIPE
jgi:hypothetical protein